MPAYFQRPENALKRANGELGIGARWAGSARGLGGRGARACFSLLRCPAAAGEVIDANCPPRSRPVGGHGFPSRSNRLGLVGGAEPGTVALGALPSPRRLLVRLGGRGPGDTFPGPEFLTSLFRLRPATQASGLSAA